MAVRPEHNGLIRPPVGLLRAQIPKSNRSSEIAGGQELSVRAETQTKYSADRLGFVTAKSGDQFACVEIPNLNNRCNARSSDQPTVWRDIATQYRKLDRFERSEFLKSGGIPKLQFSCPVRRVHSAAG